MKMTMLFFLDEDEEELLQTQAFFTKPSKKRGEILLNKI